MNRFFAKKIKKTKVQDCVKSASYIASGRVGGWCWWCEYMWRSGSGSGIGIKYNPDLKLTPTLTEF
jgi:hypothetical protein